MGNTCRVRSRARFRNTSPVFNHLSPNARVTRDRKSLLRNDLWIQRSARSMSRSRYSLIILRKTTTARTTLHRNRQSESMLVWRLSYWRKWLGPILSAILSQNNRLKTAYRRRCIGERGEQTCESFKSNLSLASFVPSFLPSFLPSAILLSGLRLPVSLAPPAIDSTVKPKAPRFRKELLFARSDSRHEADRSD